MPTPVLVLAPHDPAALLARDPALLAHGLRVGALARLMGREMGLSLALLERLEEAGRFHDLGKLFLPGFLVHKPSALNVAEYRILQRHARLGADLLAEHPATAPLAEVAHAHHEFWNGRGYPAHLRGLEIPLLARITSVADVYDAVTSDRPGGGRSHGEAVAELRSGRGTQFCPASVDAFLAVERRLARPLAS